MDALNRVLQSYMFDMLRILTYYFVTQKRTILEQVRNYYPYKDDAFLFLLKGGSAVKLWQQQDTFPIVDLGDMDCTLLIDPSLPGPVFNHLHTYLFRIVYSIFYKNITLSPEAKVDVGYYNTTISGLATILENRDYGIFKNNQVYAFFTRKLSDPLIAQAITLDSLGKKGTLEGTCPFMIAGMLDIVFGKGNQENSSNISLFKLLLNTADQRELIDIAIPHQSNPLLSYEFDLYSVGTTSHTVPSPSHLTRFSENDEPTEFAIAKPIALLYEFSVIQLPDFETRPAKLEKRKGYINYLKTRKNVRNNIRAKTTYRAITARSARAIPNNVMQRAILKSGSDKYVTLNEPFEYVSVHEKQLMKRSGITNLTFPND